MAEKFGLSILLATCGALALGTQAVAQTVDAAEAGIPAQEAETSDTYRLNEVLVTAQRRVERLQDVPISLSVISLEALETSNFTTVADIQFLSPGVNFNSNFGGGFNIRGVGTQSLLMTAEQSVGLVIDDVIQGLPEVSFAGPSYQSMIDIDRIEVLKGPQGTLFGKNSSAGVIQIVTKRPELGTQSASASLSYGSKNEVNAQGIVNIPLGQTAALRVAAGYQSRDGFVENRFNGEDLWAYDRYNIRGKLLWQPDDRLSVLLSAEYRDLEDNANGQWTLRNCGSGFGAFSPCGELAAYGVTAGPKNLAGAWDGPNYTRQESWTASGRIDYELGSATLTSITSYRDLEQPIAVDTDGTPRPIYSFNQNTSGGTQFTQEFRVTGGAGIFDYTAGSFYYNSKPFQIGRNGGTLGLVPDSSPILLSTTSIGPNAASGGSVHVEAEIESWAAFGQIEAQLTDKFRLLIGGRYTDDKVSQEINYFDTGFICQAAYAFGGTCHTTPFPPPTSQASTSANDFTYKITGQYYFTPDVNVYASYATGYKGPMISYPANQPQQLVLPETSESMEIGLKAALLDQSLLLNISAFQVEYDDFQGQQRVGTPPILYYTTTNAGGLKTKGVEADATWRATENLTLSGNLAYIPTEFTEFAIQCSDLYTNPATTPGQCNYVSPDAPAGSPPQFNAAGYPLIYSPELTFTARAAYEKVLTNGMLLTADANYSWRDEVYGIAADPNTIVPSYGLLGGQIGYGPEDGRWRVSVFGRNLLDEYFVAGIFRTPLDSGAAGTTPLSTLGYANIPALDSSRTIGVKLELNFGR